MNTIHYAHTRGDMTHFLCGIPPVPGRYSNTERLREVVSRERKYKVDCPDCLYLKTLERDLEHDRKILKKAHELITLKEQKRECS